MVTFLAIFMDIDLICDKDSYGYTYHLRVIKRQCSSLCNFIALLHLLKLFKVFWNAQTITIN